LLTSLLAALVDPSPRNKNEVGEDALQAFLALPVTEQLKTIEGDLARLPEEQQAGIVKALGSTLQQPFIPLPGPQTMAFYCQADEMLYGGAAGGGKSRLGLGCAAMRHKRSLILRRQSTELEGLQTELLDMLGREGWRSSGPYGGEHRTASHAIRLGGMREPEDWRDYAGQPRDFMYFDEGGEFLEQQVSALLSWLRSPDPNQKCQAVFGTNPPRGAEGYWLIKWFAPWLDPSFPGPAKPGELRWFIQVGEHTRWVEGPGRHEIDGETYIARSRTFIPARLSDNPFLTRDDAYLAVLQNRPEPLRSQLLKGDFLAGREDDAWQVIPSDWIQRARLRWTPDRPHNLPMTSLGVDVAQGGADRTTLAPRYGRWFAPIKVADGAQTPDGLSVATLAFGAMRDGCMVVVDMGGGWGGDAYGHLSRQLPEDAIVGFMGINPSMARSANGIESFANKRAEVWWRFREALDPDTGADVALPPDPELAAELAMPRRVPEKREIQVESKEQIRKRLGRSPDKADAVVMAWAYGDERAAQRHMPERLQTYANVGYERAKRYATRHRR
jgi:hypothetical protein